MKATISYVLISLLSAFSFGQDSLLTTIFFDTDIDKPKDTEKEKLFRIPNSINTLIIKGFADERASTNYNKNLSKRRAENVVEIQGEWSLSRKVEVWSQSKVAMAIHSNMKKGELIAFPNLLFKPGRSTLYKSSIEEMRKIASVLKEHPNIHFEIRGHICCLKPGEEEMDGLDDNTGLWNLSEARAETVYKELLKLGISSNRMKFNGYAGKFINRSKSDIANRRVEFMVTSNEKH